MRFSLFALIALSACAPKANGPIETPRLEITCPDPEARLRLVEGSTYRDLAVSRAQALRGWRLCSDALAIAQE